MKARTVATLTLILGAVVLCTARSLAEPKKPADSAPTAESSWKQLKLPAAVAKSALHNVFFLDAKHGWAVGDKGLCLATQDGGDNWEVRDTGSGATLRCVWFQDTQTGWACGDGDANAPKTGGHVVLSRPLKAGTLLSTSDGGKSWKTSWISTNFDIPWIEASAAPLLQIGVSGGDFHLDGDITRSPDGGKTWKSNRCFRALFAVRRLDDKHWLAVGSPVSVGFQPTPTSELYTSKQCRALYSADGGETWKVSQGSDGKGSLRAVTMDKKRAVLAVGDGGTILRSKDQGENWSVMESGTKEDLLAVAWASRTENTVTAVGDDGMVLVSSDGGNKWQAMAGPTTSPLLAVAAAGDQMIVAGRDGTLWRTPVKQLASLPLRARRSKEEEEKREEKKAQERSLQRLTHMVEGMREMAKRYPPGSEEAKKAAQSIKQLEAMISGQHPFLGLTFVPNTTEVAQVLPKGPADAVGIKKGDVFVRWGDTQLGKGEDLTKAVMQQKPGDKVVVEIQRDGKLQKITVEVGKRPIPREQSRGMTEVPMIGPDSKGLLIGSYNPAEPVAANVQEAALGLKPYPSASQVKPFYLYVPKSYAKDKPPPVVICLHERGPLGQFSQRTALDQKHLEACAKRSLDAWKDLAEKEGFLLMVPLGDPDILWMGVSWFTGSRPKLFEAITQTVGKTHAYDKSRVYVVASGEGAHAALATAVRRGDLLAAVAVCNPPLFEGKSLKGNTVYPETVDEMLTAARKRKTPCLILAGDKDKELRIERHTNSGVPNDRFRDSSDIPAEYLKKMADKLKDAGFPLEFNTIPTRHFAPLPADQVETTWKWLKKNHIDPSQ